MSDKLISFISQPCIEWVDEKEFFFLLINED
jgi:hypothetical protein